MPNNVTKSFRSHNCLGEWGTERKSVVPVATHKRF